MRISSAPITFPAGSFHTAMDSVAQRLNAPQPLHAFTLPCEEDGRVQITGYSSDGITDTRLHVGRLCEPQLFPVGYDPAKVRPRRTVNPTPIYDGVNTLAALCRQIASGSAGDFNREIYRDAPQRDSGGVIAVTLAKPSSGGLELYPALVVQVTVGGPDSFFPAPIVLTITGQVGYTAATAASATPKSLAYTVEFDLMPGVQAGDILTFTFLATQTDSASGALELCPWLNQPVNTLGGGSTDTSAAPACGYVGAQGVTVNITGFGRGSIVFRPFKDQAEEMEKAQAELRAMRRAGMLRQFVGTVAAPNTLVAPTPASGK